MNVLLISANTLTSPYPVYPLGLDYVAAALTPRHRIKIADMNLMNLDALAKLIGDFKPDAVGISLRNIDNTDITDPQSFMSGYEELVIVVRRHAKAKIVLGGSGFSIFPERMLHALTADFGIIGEGERLAELLNALETDQSVEGIPGILIPDRTLSPPEPITEIPRHFFDSRCEHLAYYLQYGGMLNIQTKRGCPFRCIYCTYPHIEGSRFRFMDPLSVGQMAKATQEAGARYFFITDSVFNADIAHSLAVADQFRKNGVSIPWGAFFAPLEMPKDYFESLVKAGLTHAEFGTESLSDIVLKNYGKPFRRLHAFQAHNSAVTAGLNVAHYFLFGGPGETADTLETTLLHLDKLNRSVLFLFCGIRIYPHTTLFDRAVKEKIIMPSQDLLRPVFYQSAAIGREEIIERVEARANKRVNWILGSGGNRTGELLQRMYKKGYSGPLWEFLIR